MEKYSIFYVTPEPAKGVGLESLLPNYHIICCDDKPIVDYLTRKGVKIFCLERKIGGVGENLRNAGKMLEHPKVQSYIKDNSRGRKPAILFFKPSYKIDLICKKNNYVKIGNDVDLNREFEDKINFYSLCLTKKWPVPKGFLGKMRNFSFLSLKQELGLPFVLQFGRGWAGSTTFFVESEKQWENIQSKWGEKDVKVTVKIEGPTFLNNACIIKDSVLVSLPAIQLPPPEGLMANPASTFGRQWPSGLSKNQVKKVNELTQKVGRVMKENGYKGWFGLDFILDKKNGKIYLSENNARLTASTSFYTQLELVSGIKFPLLYYHVSQFLNLDVRQAWKRVEFKASQFVYRNFRKEAVRVVKTLESGVYLLTKHAFLRKDLGVSQLNKKGEVFLSPPNLNDTINPEIETFTIETKERLMGGDSKYSSFFIEFVKYVLDNLKFSKSYTEL